MPWWSRFTGNSASEPPSGWLRARPQPLVIGHRGGGGRETENTLAAFAAARRGGADGVELDVRLSADGELIVFHDDDLRRLCGRGERIGELPLAALREVALPGGHHMPTLDEVFAELGAAMLVNVELKAEPGRRRALVTSVAAVVARHRAGERVLLSAFDPLVVHWSGRHAPALARGFLFHKRQPAPLRRAWVAPIVRPHALHPEHVLVDRVRLAEWRRRGYRVNCWTVDAPAELRRLADLGVDAIITNDPAAARAALERC